MWALETDPEAASSVRATHFLMLGLLALAGCSGATPETAHLAAQPQTAPSAGNVAAAEKLVEKLGIEPSLHRRFARFDELPYDAAIWIPKPYRRTSSNRSGVFGHIETKKERRDTSPPPVNIPPVVMTWDKFLRTVIAVHADGPDQIEILVPTSGGFVAMVTAENFENIEDPGRCRASCQSRA